MTNCAITLTSLILYDSRYNIDKVRPPYDEMYSQLKFKMPETAKMAVRKNPAIPSWSYVHRNYRNVPFSISEEKIKQLENTMWFQNQNRKVFGMVKLVDDSIGRISKFLSDTGLENNTIVVFTSDHGDLMHERKYGKTL
jgi:arylsulfatase A-like enzyme